ncbi:MAG: adenosylcobinamide-GDP ribazoletransferase [Lentisphaeria bacterium]|nr:adenosylcobinamide-GDP ribazoletransferase [Lentisphaeria bacterium]
MRNFRTALSMLTCLPAGRNFIPSEKEISHTPICFPIIGLGIGLLLAGIGSGLQRIFPPLLCAAVLTFLSELPTKAFHLDGLADTADGFLSSRPKDRILEIMHDSRIGTMGVLAIAAWSLTKFASFAVLPAELIPPALFFMSLNGRCAMVYHLIFCRYARQEGLGRLVFEQKPYAGLILSVLFSAGLTYAVLPFPYLAMPLLVLAFALLWSLCCRCKIGGGTGDTLGAAEELSELLTLLTLAAIRT